MRNLVLLTALFWGLTGNAEISFREDFRPVCKEGYHLEFVPSIPEDSTIGTYECVLNKEVVHPSENLEKREEEPFGRAILFSEKGEFIKDFVVYGYPTHWARTKALSSCEREKKAALNEYCKKDMDF